MYAVGSGPERIIWHHIMRRVAGLAAPSEVGEPVSSPSSSLRDGILRGIARPTSELVGVAEAGPSIGLLPLPLASPVDAVTAPEADRGGIAIGWIDDDDDRRRESLGTPKYE